MDIVSLPFHIRNAKDLKVGSVAIKGHSKMNEEFMKDFKEMLEKVETKANHAKVVRFLFKTMDTYASTHPEVLTHFHHLCAALGAAAVTAAVLEQKERRPEFGFIHVQRHSFAPVGATIHCSDNFKAPILYRMGDEPVPKFVLNQLHKECLFYLNRVSGFSLGIKHSELQFLSREKGWSSDIDVLLGFPFVEEGEELPSLHELNNWKVRVFKVLNSFLAR